MKLHNIAINNLRRRKAKVCFLVMGLLVGVASVVALLSITQSLAEDMVHKMDEFGANILIIPKAEGLSLNYGGIDLGGLSFGQKEISQEDLAKIKTIDNAANIRLVSPKVLDVFEMNGQKALAVGVDFPSELALKKWWVINGTTPKSDSEVILGRDAAVKLGVNVGSRLDIKGSELWVSGVLDTTGSQDDSLVFMPLPVSQKIFGKEGKISMVEIAALCKNCPISDIVNQISAIIPNGKVTAVQQVVAGRMDTLNHFQRFSLGISGLVLLVGAMVVFVTMMGSVNERTREIGIFSAIGFRSSHIMKIILLEAFVVSFSAGLLGYLVGIGVTYGTLRALSDHAPNLTIDYSMAAGSVFLSVLVGLLASFYPARSAAAMDPSEALRTL